MKKLFFAALTVFAFASCTKNEVVSIEEELQEITFQNVVNIFTKTNVAPLNDTVKFKATAFYLPEGKNWNNHTSEAKVYFSDVMVGCVDGIWKCVDDTLYWPKKGSLKVFAWTDNTATLKDEGEKYWLNSLEVDSGLSFIYSNQPEFIPNVELFVSDPCIPTIGTPIPLVFRPILTKLTFSVSGPNASQSASSQTDEQTSFVLDLIRVVNACDFGVYQQVVDSDGQNWSCPGICDGVYFPVYTSTLGLDVTTKVDLVPSTDDAYIVPPLKFLGDDRSTWYVQPYDTPYDNENEYLIDNTYRGPTILEVFYRYITHYNGNDIVNKVRVTKPLKDIYGDGWEMGKHYHLNITLSPDEVLWDPKVLDWDTDSASIIL